MFLPRMPSRLTSFLGLRKSTWNSPRRPISSRACMPWNSSTSSPSGVVTSIRRIVLGMALSCTRRFRGPNHQPGDGIAGFETEFRRFDFRCQLRVRQDALDVRTRVAIAAVRAEDVLAVATADNQLLDREDQ